MLLQLVTEDRDNRSYLRGVSTRHWDPSCACACAPIRAKDEGMLHLFWWFNYSLLTRFALSAFSSSFLYFLTQFPRAVLPFCSSLPRCTCSLHWPFDRSPNSSTSQTSWRRVCTRTTTVIVTSPRSSSRTTWTSRRGTSPSRGQFWVILSYAPFGRHAAWGEVPGG